MDPKTQNNSSDELDLEEKQLRDEAMQIDPPRADDATHEDDVTRSERAAARAEDTASKNADAAKADAAKKKATEDKAAKDNASKDNTDEKAEADKKAAAEKAAAEAKAKATEDDESRLTPYEKERRRLDRSWKKLDEEKAQTRKEREAVEAERKALADERAKAAQRPKPEKPKHNGHTAEEYEAAAEDFEKEGKMAEAEFAKKRAAELRAKEAEQAKEAGAATDEKQFVTLETGARITPEEQQQMTAEWTANLSRLGRENPDLMKEGAPLRAVVTELLGKDERGKTRYPILHSHASGIHYAVEVAKLKLAAGKVPELSKRVAELEAENKELKGLTSLPPSGPTSRREKPKPGESGNLDQDEKELREAAMAQDAGS